MSVRGARGLLYLLADHATCVHHTPSTGVYSIASDGFPAMWLCPKVAEGLGYHWEVDFEPSSISTVRIIQWLALEVLEEPCHTAIGGP